MGAVQCGKKQKKGNKQINKNPVTREEAESDLRNFTTPAQIHEMEDKYMKSPKLLYNCVVSKLKGQSPQLFISQESEAANTILDGLHKLMENHYIPMMTAGLSEIIIDRSIVKTILDCYLIILSIKAKEDVWWTEQYFYGRRKMLTNYFQPNQRYVEHSLTSPIINFIQLVTTCIDKQFNNVVHTVPELLTKETIQHDRFFEQLKADFMLGSHDL